MKMKNLKKVLAGIMAGTMILGGAMSVSAEVVWNDGSETLTGTAWWDGMQRGKDYTMSGDGIWQLSIKANALDNGYGAFNVEIFDEGQSGYITTGSDKNIWVAEGYNGVGTVSGAASEFNSELTEGNTYTVTITREGDDFTFAYADQTSGSDIITMKANAPASDTVVVHVMAQVGTYEVRFGEVVEESDDPAEPEDGDEAADGDSAEPADGDTAAPADGNASAKTGETAPIALYVMLGAACGLLLIGAKKRLAK